MALAVSMAVSAVMVARCGNETRRRALDDFGQWAPDPLSEAKLMVDGGHD